MAPRVPITMDPTMPVEMPTARGEVAPEPDPAPDQTDIAREAREKFLSLAHSRWKQVEEVEGKARARMLEDLRFLEDPWPEQIRRDRQLDGRPCLHVDRLSQPIKQVVNQARAMRPSIRVNPVDSGADPETAEVLQGIIRHIENRSDADVAYDTAAEDQTQIGVGYWRVITEYCDPTSFDQDLSIRRVRNPFSIYLDPAALQFDGSDARFGFVIEDVTTEEFRVRFPDVEIPGSFTEADGIGNQLLDWYPDGRIRIAEYFYREETQAALVELTDPATGEKMTQTVPLTDAPPLPYPPGVRVRLVPSPVVRWALITGTEILEGNEDKTAGRVWPGKYIPIVPVYGDEIDINNELDRRGMIFAARDTIRMSDFWKTAATEMIALAPKAPYIGVEGQFEGHPEWKTANRRNYPYLEYVPKSLGGSLAPPPKRDIAEPPIQAIVLALQQNENDLRAVTGYVDVQAHETRSETSGRAILARQKQADLGNSNYLDNLSRSIRHTGRILLDLIPAVYDAPRIVRILGLDDVPQTVLVQKGPVPKELPAGVSRAIDLSTGRYDVTISVGPSHQSLRAEAVDAMLELVRAAPPLLQAIPDLLVQNMDWPGAQQMAKRLKKTLPSALQDPPEGQPEIPPQIQAQMAQAQQLIDQLTAKVNELLDERAATIIQVESKERIESQKIQANLMIEQAKLDAQRAQALMDAKIAEIQQRIALIDSGFAAQQQMLSMTQPQPPAPGPAEAGSPPIEAPSAGGVPAAMGPAGPEPAPPGVPIPQGG